MDEIEEFCDRIALIDHGRVVIVGTPKELKDHVGAGATLDDVFIRLVGASKETEGSYDEVRRARRAAREHG
jgi:ABC-2 type transport system ATP-binding protein